MIGQTLELTISTLGSHGEGIAHLGDDRVFVARALPGDVVMANIVDKKRGQWLAKIQKIIKPSPMREVPLCQHFEECGGCDFQHLSYEEEIKWKLGIAEHWIKRSPLEPFCKSLSLKMVSSENPYHYRHRLRFRVVSGKPSFYKPRSREALILNECPVTTHEAWQLAAQTALKSKEGDELTTSTGDGFDHQKNLLYYKHKEQKIYFDERGFTQSHLRMNEKVLDHLQMIIDSLPQKKCALDCYSGAGNFTSGLVKNFDQVDAIESDARGIQFLKINAPSATIISSKVEDALSKLKKSYDFILVDPPRVGMGSAVHDLVKLNASTIVMISCQLSSLIVDLTAMVKKGPYKIESWTLFDFFPRTKHIESMVVLRR